MSDGKIVETKPNEVPAAWGKLGDAIGFDPPTAEELRLWIVAMDGCGKTSFLSGIPRNIILDFDNAARSVVGSLSTRIAIKGYDSYQKALAQLKKDAEGGRRPFDRVTFDTVDEWVGMIAVHLQNEKNIEDIGEYGTSGSGWRMLRDRCWSVIRELEGLGYTWAISGHLSLKTDKIPGTKTEMTRLAETIFPTMGGKIRAKSDFKLTLLVENKNFRPDLVLPSGKVLKDKGKVEQVTKYFVDCTTTAANEGKSRAVSGMEKRFEIPLIGGWQEFERRYNDAIEVEKLRVSAA